MGAQLTTFTMRHSPATVDWAELGNWELPLSHVSLEVEAFDIDLPQPGPSIVVTLSHSKSSLAAIESCVIRLYTVLDDTEDTSLGKVEKSAKRAGHPCRRSSIALGG